MMISYQERGDWRSSSSSSTILIFWASHHSSWVISSKYNYQYLKVTVGGS